MSAAWRRSRNTIMLCLPCMIYLLSLVSAGNVPFSSAESDRGYNYQESDRLYFAPIANMSGHYGLKNYVKEIQSRWVLGHYVATTRAILAKIMIVDWDFMRKQLYEEQSPDPMQLIQQNIAVLFLTILGLTLGVCFWMFGFVFCCNRFRRCCCQPHSERMRQRAAVTEVTIAMGKPSGIISGVLALGTCMFLLVGAAGLYSAGQRMAVAPTFTVNILDEVIADATLFGEGLYEAIRQVAYEDLNFTTAAVFSEIDTLMKPIILSDRLHLEKYKAEDVESASQRIKPDAIKMTFARKDADYFGVQIMNLKSEIKTEFFKDALETETTTCSTNTGSDANDLPCSLLPGASVPDFNSLLHPPELSGYDNMTDDLSTREYDNVKTAVLAYIDESKWSGLKIELDQQSSDVLDAIEAAMIKAKDIVLPNIQLARQQLDELQEVLDKQNATVATMAPYAEIFLQVPKLFLAPVLVVVLIVAVAVLGLVLAMLSFIVNQLPCLQGRNIARHSSRALWCTVIVSIMVVPLYLIPGSLLFAVSSPLVAMCVPLQDLSIFAEITDDKVIDREKSPYYNVLGKTLFPNNSVELLIGPVLRQCRHNNTAVYPVMKLNNLFDVMKAVDMRFPIPDLSVLRNNMEIAIHNAAGQIKLPQFVNDQHTAQMVMKYNIGTDAVMKQLYDDLMTMEENAETLKRKLEEAKDGLIKASYFDANDVLKKLLDKLAKIISFSLPALSDESGHYGDALFTMEARTTETYRDVDGLYGPALHIQKSIDRELQQDIMNDVDAGLNRIIGFSDQYNDHLKKRLMTEIGQCGILSDVYDGIVAGICAVFLDAVNGIWMSLCIIGTFLMAYVGCAFQLISYLRCEIAASEHGGQGKDMEDRQMLTQEDGDTYDRMVEEDEFATRRNTPRGGSTPRGSSPRGERQDRKPSKPRRKEEKRKRKEDSPTAKREKREDRGSRKSQRDDTVDKKEHRRPPRKEGDVTVGPRKPPPIPSTSSSTSGRSSPKRREERDDRHRSSSSKIKDGKSSKHKH